MKKAMATRLIDVEKMVAKLEKEWAFFSKSIANYLFLQDGKGLRVPARKTVLCKLSVQHV